ncbi:MAG: aminotransferase class IV [Patescibacteria group bacterium]
MIVYINGKFINANDAKISIFDPGFLYGDGIFETLRTYNGEIWQMEEHLERLYESAKMRGWKLHVKPSEIAEAVSKTVKKNNFKESRVRITITPGVKQPTVFIWCQPLLALPKRVYSRGVSAITFPLERPFPQMKTTSMQPLLIARAEMLKKRAFEALLINSKGYITEGTWTNVFIVRKKKIITPRLGVLLGTTRSTVLKLAKKLFRIKFKDITRREVLNADECFVTNAPKGIVPIVKIDGEKIGTGRVGPITKHLMKEFEKKILT